MAMLSGQNISIVSGCEGPCSDCGQITWLRTSCFDPHTCSTLDLCATCAAAWMQRSTSPPGACGDL